MTTTKSGRTEEYRVWVLTCGTCGFSVSALDSERMKAGMLEHLIHTHSEIPRD